MSSRPESRAVIPNQSPLSFLQTCMCAVQRRSHQSKDQLGRLHSLLQVNNQIGALLYTEHYANNINKSPAQPCQHLRFFDGT